ALALSLVAGCARWKVVAQNPVNPQAVRDAPAIAVAPLAFALPPVEGETPEKWNDHLRAWSEAFQEHFAERAPRLGRAIAYPPPNLAISDGLFVSTVVRAIVKADFMGRDRVVADLTIYDGRTRAPLLTATLETTNKRGGWENYTFGGRIKLALLNLS